MAALLAEVGLLLNIRKILVEGETLSRGCRRDLEEFYGGQVFDVYGANEFGSAFGFECKAHSGMHLNADYFIFEYVRDGETGVTDGPAEVLITGLKNWIMPLIRYQIGDIVVPSGEERCACGPSLPRLESIQGRRTDGIQTKSGLAISHGVVVHYLESVVGVRNFQITQNSLGSFTIRLMQEDIRNGRAKNVERYLEVVAGETLDTELLTWGTGEMPAKYRPVISRLAPGRL